MKSSTCVRINSAFRLVLIIVWTALLAFYIFLSDSDDRLFGGILWLGQFLSPFPWQWTFIWIGYGGSSI